MAADMLGSFYSEPTFYEYVAMVNPETGEEEIVDAQSIPESPAVFIRPAPVVFDGPVIALVNSGCISSCEGVALGVSRLSNGEVVGFYGTNGSFGMMGPQAAMPGDITVRWPVGRSLDDEFQIQLDSQDGVGGVAPTRRVPMNTENTLRVARGEDVELEYALGLLEGAR